MNRLSEVPTTDMPPTLKRCQTARAVSEIGTRKADGERCLSVLQDTRLMKSAGTQSISMALRAIVVATFGLIFMFLTSPVLTGLTIAILPVTLLAFRTCACQPPASPIYLQAVLQSLSKTLGPPGP